MSLMRSVLLAALLAVSGSVVAAESSQPEAGMAGHDKMGRAQALGPHMEGLMHDMQHTLEMMRMNTSPEKRHQLLHQHMHRLHQAMMSAHGHKPMHGKHGDGKHAGKHRCKKMAAKSGDHHGKMHDHGKKHGEASVVPRYGQRR